MKKFLTTLQVVSMVFAIIEALKFGYSIAEHTDGNEALAYCVGYLVLSWVLELFIKDDDTPVLR